MFEEYADKVRKWIKEESYEFYERPDIETKLTIDIEENKYTIISIAFHKDSLDSILSLQIWNSMKKNRIC
jgi:hypothetical protein